MYNFRVHNQLDELKEMQVRLTMGPALIEKVLTVLSQNAGKTLNKRVFDKMVFENKTMFSIFKPEFIITPKGTQIQIKAKDWKTYNTYSAVAFVPVEVHLNQPIPVITQATIDAEVAKDQAELDEINQVIKDFDKHYRRFQRAAKLVEKYNKTMPVPGMKIHLNLY